ncbi:MAG TPA: hypothetical protein VF458_03775 [Ktedonobacteraceae bacterium]
MGQYDTIMKLLVDKAPEAVAQFVLNEWQKQEGADTLNIQVTSVTLLSEEFQSEELKGDGVWLIHGLDGPQMLASVEYQSTLPPIMPIRSMEYLARSKKKHWKMCGQLPAMGVVLYLFDEEDTAECPMIWPGPNGTTTLAYNYLLTNLRTVPREEVLALQEPALWPLALLTQGPVDRIIVKDMFADLLNNKLYNILPIGNSVASWFLRGNDLSWLNEEYQRMYEIFKDAPATKWIQEDGRADERRIAAEERKKLIADFQETEEKYREELKNVIADFRGTVVSMVSQQYPKLKRLAQNQVRLLEDVGRIRQLIVDLNATRNSDEAQDVLLSVTDSMNEKDTDSIEIVQTPPVEPL